MSAVTLNCTTCGESLGMGARFCEGCGTAAAVADPVPPATAPAAAQPQAQQPAAATVRGVIMRDTNAGPGMILVNGEKKTFTLEQHWQGNAAPQVQTQVDVLLDAQGQVTTVTPARIGVEDLEKYKDMAKQAFEGGAPVVLAYADRVGKPVLAAMLVVMISWIWLPALSVTIMAGMTQSATLFDVLRLANAGASLDSIRAMGGGSSGLYGVLCVAAMLAPLLPTFLKHKYAPLGYCAPLAFLLLTGLVLYMKVHSMASAARDSMRSFGGNQMDQVANAMMQQITNALSVGFGTYLSLAAAAYLASRGISRLLAAR